METQLWRPNVGIAELGEQIFTASLQTASSPSPWSWSSFVAAARRRQTGCWPQESAVPAIGFLKRIPRYLRTFGERGSAWGPNTAQLSVVIHFPKGINKIRHHHFKANVFVIGA